MSKTYNSVKHFISTFLVLALVLSALPAAAFAASEDPNLNNELTIALGEKRYLDGEVWDQFFIFPATKGASQTFTVSDESIVTASIIDSPFPEHLGQFKALKLIGNKVGTSVVTVNETYNGKTATVAKTIVTVAASYITEKMDGNFRYDYTHEYGLGEHDTGFTIINQNVEATYTFTADKEGLTVRQVFQYGATTRPTNVILCNATSLGDYKVTVTETYQGVTRVVGVVDFHIFPTTVTPSMTLMVGDWALPVYGILNTVSGEFYDNLSVINHFDSNYSYSFKSDTVDMDVANGDFHGYCSFETHLRAYNNTHPENPYDPNQYYISDHLGSLSARLAGTQVLHVYRDRFTDVVYNGKTLTAGEPEWIGDCTITVLPDPTIDPTIPTVSYVPCKVLLDGRPIILDAYLFQENGGGANYVMLRDVAELLNGSNAQFEVGWTAQDGIILTTNTPYTSVYMESKGYDPKPYTPNASTITINGQKAELPAFTIAGNNYFKLRDLGAALGFGVDWDGTTGTVVITTTAN